MSTMNDARTLIAKIELAMKEQSRQIEKGEKRQIKADIAALNKALNKCKPEKMNENDISELRSTTARLEASASHLVSLNRIRQRPKDAGRVGGSHRAGRRQS